MQPLYRSLHPSKILDPHSPETQKPCSRKKPFKLANPIQGRAAVRLDVVTLVEDEDTVLEGHLGLS